MKKFMELIGVVFIRRWTQDYGFWDRARVYLTQRHGDTEVFWGGAGLAASYCDHPVVAMMSVKTGGGWALGAHRACNESRDIPDRHATLPN